MGERLEPKYTRHHVERSPAEGNSSVSGRAQRAREPTQLAELDVPAHDSTGLSVSGAPLRNLAEDEGWRAIAAVDRSLLRLEQSLARDLGEDSEALGFVADARERLYHASRAYAAEAAPRASTYLARALARSARRR